MSHRAMARRFEVPTCGEEAYRVVVPLQNLQQLLPGQQVSMPEARSRPVTVRAGVLFDSRIQERWVLESLTQALAVPGVQLAAVAMIGKPPGTTLAARAHRLVDRVDRWLRCRDEPLFANIDVAAALQCPVQLDVPALYGDAGWQLDGAGAALLHGARVDVWLCFTSVAPAVTLPRIARRGVWAVEIGLRVPAGNRWAGATEICERSAVTVAQLVDYARPGFNTIYRACGATVANSARRNRLLTLRTAMSFFRRQLVRLTRAAENGGDSWQLAAQLPVNYPDCTPPTVRAAARLGWRLLTRIAMIRWHALGWHDQWRIGYYFADEAADATHRPADLRCLVPPGDRDWADPFIVEHGGRRFIFFEELPYAAGKGHISAIEIGTTGQPGTVRRVLSRPYHLSYPFIFSWNGELYMLPETAGNSTVELYRCEQFPDRWSLHKVLLEGIRAFDATLLREADRWWLFVNVAEPGADPSEELHLYWSETPLGPWHAHGANPVISDARRARGAGPLFRRDGVLYRPSQDCSSTYGYAVSINRVDVLDLERYEETPVGRIAPDWRADMRCLHTYGAAGNLRVVDYMVRRPRWSAESSLAGHHA